MKAAEAPIVCGNWKMNLGPSAGVALARAVVELVSAAPQVKVWIAPPFLSIPAVAEVVAKTPVKLGSQNVHWESSGAFTGEVSVDMLKEVGASFAIVGHSERRHVLLETSSLCAERARGALAKGLS